MNNNLSYLKEQEKFLCKMQGMNINCLSVNISKTLSQCCFNVKMRDMLLPHQNQIPYYCSNKY